MSKDVIEMVGVVTEAHKGGLFRVEIEMGESVRAILARPSGKMKKFNIKLAVGDEVKVEMSPYDLDKGRITYRV